MQVIRKIIKPENIKTISRPQVPALPSPLAGDGQGGGTGSHFLNRLNRLNSVKC
jgi:hypothetical protein